MIELIQFPWSPFCIVQRRILEFSGAPFKITNIPNTDRSLVWRLTRQRYYGVPIIRDRRTVVFEIEETSQVLAKYLDQKLQLGLFPPEWEGLQSLVWRAIESDVEGCTFKLNDIYFHEFLPRREHLEFIRFKERKFGRGCIENWRKNQSALLNELTRHLMPFEQMLAHRPFLLDSKPRFLDFNLYGMLGNFLYTGHYQLPGNYDHLNDWYRRMTSVKFVSHAREKKLHS